MAMTLVSHPGIVLGWNKEKLRIQINTGSACGGCAVKGSCSAGGSQENRDTEIWAVGEKGQSFQPQDRVTVTMTTTQGFQAVWWAFILPLLLFLITVFTLGPWVKNESLTALGGLGVLGLSWTALYFLRKFFEKQFVFYARRNP